MFDERFLKEGGAGIRMAGIHMTPYPMMILRRSYMATHINDIVTVQMDLNNSGAGEACTSKFTCCTAELIILAGSCRPAEQL